MGLILDSDPEILDSFREGKFLVGRRDVFCEGGKGGKCLGKENKEKEKENLEVDIFGGEKKNVTGKGGKYFKREYTFCRGGDELGRTIFGEGQYFFAEEKNTEKENIFYGGEGKEKNIWKRKIYVLRKNRKTERKKEKDIMKKEKLLRAG